MDVDEMGVAVKFQGQTAKAARYCVRWRVDPGDGGEAEWNPPTDHSE